VAIAVSGRVATSLPVLLVDRALGLGDLCTAVPAIRALATGHPDHHLVVATPASLEPLARLVGAHATIPLAGIMAPMPDEARRPAIAVNLHGRGPQSIERLVALEPDQLVTFRHDAVAASRGGPLWRDDEHEVDRWCRLVASTGVDVDPTDLTIDIPCKRSNRTVVVHAGAAAPGRRWPADRFAKVVAHLHRRGHRVLLTGSAEERSLTEEIVSAAGPPTGRVEPPRSLAGTTDVGGLIRVVAEAALVISNDTGVAHLATSTATRSVVLFGPTDPAKWGPPPGDRHIAIWHGAVGDPHAGRLDPGLAGISVEEVIAAVDCQISAISDDDAIADGLPTRSEAR
jgi:ADP-heptose:LPS heptosyltransferase